GELQGVLTSRLVFNLQLGLHHFTDVRYDAQTSFDDKPTTLDNATLIQTGPSLFQNRRPRRNVQPLGSLTYIPSSSFLGKHELKTGFIIQAQVQGDGSIVGRHGSYLLIFDTLTGLVALPSQIRTDHYPRATMQRL